MLEELLKKVEELRKVVDETEKRGNDYTGKGGTVVHHLDQLKAEVKRLQKDGYDAKAVQRMHAGIYLINCFDYETKELSNALYDYSKVATSEGRYIISKTKVPEGSHIGKTTNVAKYKTVEKALYELTKVAKTDKTAIWCVYDTTYNTAEGVLYVITFDKDGRARLDY